MFLKMQDMLGFLLIQPRALCIGVDGTIYTLFQSWVNKSQGLDFSIQSFDPQTGVTSILLATIWA